jgi:tRNA(Ile)-lysidine synthase
MKQKFLRFIHEHNLFNKSNKILVAVSGGADSIALLQLLVENGFTCGIAHCNFQLRRNDSDLDTAFVKGIAGKKSLFFHYKKFETTAFAKEKKISVEMAARELRYEWFEEIRKEFNYARIATAHHLNDSAETFFLNLFRGTGIAGLTGIAPRRNWVVRPILFATRPEILDYIKSNKLDFRTDQTNFDTNIERNWIRHELIPVIEKKYPSLIFTIENNMQYLNEASFFFNQKIKSLLQKWVVKNGEEEKIPCGHILYHKSGKTILHEWLYCAGFNASQIDDIFESLSQQPGKQFFSQTHQLLKDRKYLILAPLSMKDLSEYFIYEEKKIEVAGLEFELCENKNIDFKKNNAVQFLDYSKLEFPLILRRWRKGDYFYPFGMKNKKKKVSDYFIDEKINRAEKEQAFVLQSGNYIAAIVNYRINERFKITDGTRQVFKITALTKK